jgi:hypothetical protein
LEVISYITENVKYDTQEVRYHKDNNDELKGLEKVPEEDDGHDLVLVHVNVVG